MELSKLPWPGGGGAGAAASAGAPTPAAPTSAEEKGSSPGLASKAGLAGTLIGGPVGGMIGQAVGGVADKGIELVTGTINSMAAKIGEASQMAQSLNEQHGAAPSPEASPSPAPGGLNQINGPNSTPARQQFHATLQSVFTRQEFGPVSRSNDLESQRKTEEKNKSSDKGFAQGLS